MNQENLENLVGTLEKIIYKSQESGFIVALLKINSKESCTITGLLQETNPGEKLTLVGNWTRHPKFGNQFVVKECSKKLPESIDGIKKYLSSGLIKGIGPKYAARLVDKFGTRTLEIIDKEPHKLSKIDGIGEKRVQAIIDAWVTQKEISKVMVFLQEKDVSTAFAVKIFKTYGQASIDLIQENPYRLVEDIWGVGFKTADKVAIKLGISHDSLHRVKSGIIHSITEQLNNGHLYADLVELKEKSLELLELNDNSQAPILIKQALNELYSNDKIKLITYANKNFITLPKYYFSEKAIASKIKLLKEKTIKNKNLDFDQIYKNLRLADARNIELNEDQQKGIISCLQNKITIITGGPGTGKTTLIRRLLEICDLNQIKYQLCAPTGRAAKRIFEGTGRNAETIHRLLEFSPEIMNFLRNEQNTLQLDLLIIDEASMIDVFLMNSLLKAIPWNAQLVLLGDIDQLPSVGAGNILNDLINSKQVEVIRLTQIFRQAQDSLIIVNAHKINKGEFPIAYAQNSKQDFKYVKMDKPEDFFDLLKKIYSSSGLAKYKIDPKDSIVLCPMNRGVIGTQRINQELQQILNPPKPAAPQISRFGQIYQINDRVMQIKNNYDKFVFNGDIGNIININLEDQKIIVSFGEKEVDYDFSELDELTLAYSISIHKSQGSEFKAVIIPIFMQHFVMLQRNLIYTAITRAKELCIFVGETRAIAMGIKNNKATTRYTFLEKYLTEGLSAR